jgi:hypothetical protein
MGTFRVKTLVVGVVAVASSIFLSGCEVKGGATLSPIGEFEFLDFDFESEGEALLAGSAKIEGEGETIRSAGTFRNRTAGVAFTFRANETDTLSSSMTNAVSAVMSSFETDDVQCALFFGEYRRLSGTDEQLAATGLLVSVVFQVEGETFALVLALSDGPTYGYFGQVTKGKLIPTGGIDGCAIGI